MSLSNIISQSVRAALKSEISRLEVKLKNETYQRGEAKRTMDAWQAASDNTQAELDTAKAYLAKIEADK